MLKLSILLSVQPARHYILICFSLCNLLWDVVDMAQSIYLSAIFVDYLTFVILPLECHDGIVWLQIDSFFNGNCSVLSWYIF
jgi:hypothetical protein